MKKMKLPVRFTGQHFTVDKVLIKDAIKQANITQQDTVLDIGAGKGFITIHLLKCSHKVIAIENDLSLIRHLHKKFAHMQNVQVVGIDFRKYKLPDFPFKVVSNIPYGITSDILKILMFENMENFLGGSIVLQSKPAKKLFLRRIYNPYTVFYHTFYDMKFMYKIKPDSFLPPPTVNSALLRINKKPATEIGSDLKHKYFGFVSNMLRKPDLSVRAAFKSIFRKKQIRSISEDYDIDLDSEIIYLLPEKWEKCFLRMLEIIPEKFHPS